MKYSLMVVRYGAELEQKIRNSKMEGFLWKEMYLQQNNAFAEIYLTDDLPEANPISGKYKHIIARTGTPK